MNRTPIKRKTPLRATAPIKRGRSKAKMRPSSPQRTPIRPTNPKRRPAKFARNYGGPDGEHAEFVRSQRCACHGRSRLPEDRCSGRIEVAHVVPRGAGGANGCWADTAPLCTKHHREAGEWRTSARAAFEAKYGVDLRRIADDLAVDRIVALAWLWIADPAGVGEVDGLALLRWVRRRLDRECPDPDAEASFGLASIAVGLTLGLLGETLDPDELTRVVRLCAASMEVAGAT